MAIASPLTDDSWGENEGPTEDDVFEYLMFLVTSTAYDKITDQADSPLGYVPDDDEVARRLDEEDYSIPV